MIKDKVNGLAKETKCKFDVKCKEPAKKVGIAAMIGAICGIATFFYIKRLKIK